MNVKTQILNIFLETSPSIVIITNAQTLSNSTIRIRGFVTGPSVHMIMIGANILIGRFHYIMDLRALSFPQSSNKTKHIFLGFRNQESDNAREPQHANPTSKRTDINASTHPKLCLTPWFAFPWWMGLSFATEIHTIIGQHILLGYFPCIKKPAVVSNSIQTIRKATLKSLVVKCQVEVRLLLPGLRPAENAWSCSCYAAIRDSQPTKIH